MLPLQLRGCLEIPSASRAWCLHTLSRARTAAPPGHVWPWEGHAPCLLGIRVVKGGDPSGTGVLPWLQGTVRDADAVCQLGRSSEAMSTQPVLQKGRCWLAGDVLGVGLVLESPKVPGQATLGRTGVSRADPFCHVRCCSYFLQCVDDKACIADLNCRRRNCLTLIVIQCWVVWWGLNKQLNGAIG